MDQENRSSWGQSACLIGAAGPLFDFAAVINEFLQSHLFGDIFVRDTLDWPSRELATVGALAATPSVESQLRSHMRASIRGGISPAQLRQLGDLIEQSGDPSVESRARAAWEEALTDLNILR